MEEDILLTHGIERTNKINYERGSIPQEEELKYTIHLGGNYAKFQVTHTFFGG